MGAVTPLKGKSSASMTRSNFFRFNHKYINISLPNIMSYLRLLESSTWTFPVTFFLATISGRIKSILNFRLVVIIRAFMCHWITAFYLGVSFFIRFTITIVELHPLYNRVWKLLNFALHFLVFIHLFIIRECWLFKFLCV